MDDLMGVIKDRLVLEVPSAAIIPSIIRRSDWVALMSKQTLAALDCSNGLQTYDLDFSYTPRAAFMHWHIRSKDDPGREWFREQVVTVLENYKDT
jgi:DNA-binding transcriptional LysR family regulator